MGKKNFEKIIVVFLLLASVGLRIFSGYRQFSGDVTNHLGWSKEIVTSGTTGFYERPIEGISIPNYPSVSTLGFFVSYKIFQTVQEGVIYLNSHVGAFPSKLVWAMEQTNAAALFVKIPAFIGDYLLAYGVYLVAKNLYKLKNAWMLAMFVLFNPALFYVSAIWGQIEGLVMGLVILSGLMALKNKTVLSILLFTLACLTKQTALWLLPALLVLWINRPVDLIKGLAGGFLMALITYIPFYGTGLKFVNSYLSTLEGSSSVTSDKAFNFWYFVTGMVPDSNLIANLSIRNISIIVVVMGVILTTMWLYRAKTETNFWRGMWVMSLVAFFLQTRVHERHLYPAVVLSIFLRKELALFVYVALSIYFMVNLYWSLGLSFL